MMGGHVDSRLYHYERFSGRLSWARMFHVVVDRTGKTMCGTRRSANRQEWVEDQLDPTPPQYMVCKRCRVALQHRLKNMLELFGEDE